MNTGMNVVACKAESNVRTIARDRIRRVKPWTRSTGPKTPEGRARSALNRLKHGRRSCLHQLRKELLAAIRHYRRTGTLEALDAWDVAHRRWLNHRRAVAGILAARRVSE